MECNVGGLDRAIRIAVSTAALGFASSRVVNPGWRVALAAFAAGEAFTALSRYCPVNQALGIDTCHGDKAALLGSEEQLPPESRSYLEEPRPEHYAG
ncbi:MAG: DUF2892 domain-containing protein [Verrucomicrobiia bacterium]